MQLFKLNCTLMPFHRRIKWGVLLFGMTAMLGTQALEYQPTQLSYESSMYAPTEHTHVLDSLGQHVQFNVIDREQNKQLPIYVFQGEYWIAGTPKAAYAITLNNRLNDRRALTTVSVDGINVLTGEDAHVLQRGYVLSPNNRYSITGWRKNQSEVAAFKFAHPKKSYAANTERPHNIGVIGVAVFPEQYYLPPPPPMLESASTAQIEPALGQSSKHIRTEAQVHHKTAMSKPGLGTQHGERERSRSVKAAFERESNIPSEVIEVRYDTIENLVARGVLRWVPQAPKVLPQTLTPSAFPNNGYVPDPHRHWQRRH